MDEVHFASKELTKTPVVSPIGTRVIRILKGPIDVRFSATTLLNPEDPENPLFVNIREQSNTQYDFLEFISACIENNYLKEGDTLVMDNARIHNAEVSFSVLRSALSVLNIEIIFLPTYSPELNPCELVFNVVKNYIRKRKRSSNFALEVLESFSQINIEFIQKCYTHCANNVFKKKPFVTPL